MNLSKTHQYMVGALLMLLMILTRSSHTGSAINLPDASWAIFFLAAFYLNGSLRLFPVFMLAAWSIDLAAVRIGGVDPFCLTPAYFTLVPAYGSLWLAGRWYAGVHRDRLSSLLPLLGAFLLGVGVCEILSSGGFYLFSGHFQSHGWVEYLERTIGYFPSFLATTLLYLSLAVCVHAAVRVHVRANHDKRLEHRAG